MAPADTWITTARSGVDPSGREAQAVAAEHVAWLSSIPGTPGFGSRPEPDDVEGLAAMDVDDERFASTYGGAESARFVRDALVVFAAESL